MQNLPISSVYVRAQTVLNRTLSIKEVFWKQKVGARWTCEGDHNTRYFHSIVQGRHIHARIQSIISASGEVFESPETIQPSAVSFFQKLLSAHPQSFNPIRPEDVFQAVLDFFSRGHLPRVLQLLLLSCFQSGRMPIRRLEHLTEFRHQHQPFTYLGVSLFKGARKIFLYDDLVHKVRNRISSSASRLLSFGGQITLIRSVLSSIPLNLLQIMKPPKDTHPLLATILHYASAIWKRLKYIGPQAETRIAWKLGHGQIFFWHDCWMGKSTLADQHPHMPHSSIQVRDLFDDTGWSTNRLLELVPYTIAEKIRSIHIIATIHDQIMWKDTSDGRFATKSAWQLVRTGHTIQAVYNMI
ncbi:RNase H domain-containing protein [Abeliophyllum distichum]|uniref:RNase H domain-containing protein n=1 Tax=Abeliophyllum distichum TaxID=126358 RepID=A0ABD1UQM2_9LAMI